MFRYLVSLLASRGLPLEHKADDILYMFRRYAIWT